MASSVQTLIAYLAAEHRKRARDPERIAGLREQICAQQLEDHIRAAWPKLSPATRARIAAPLTAETAGDGSSP